MKQFAPLLLSKSTCFQVGSAEQAVVRRGAVREHTWAYERSPRLKRLVQLRVAEGVSVEGSQQDLEERRASHAAASTSGEWPSSLICKVVYFDC